MHIDKGLTLRGESFAKPLLAWNQSTVPVIRDIRRTSFGA